MGHYAGTHRGALLFRLEWWVVMGPCEPCVSLITFARHLLLGDDLGRRLGLVEVRAYPYPGNEEGSGDRNNRTALTDVKF
jgi:hypothetical protein